jgi:hypothetical protein
LSLDRGNGTCGSHAFELPDVEFGHLLELIDELYPFFELCDEVPGISEVQHDYEGAIL